MDILEWVLHVDRIETYVENNQEIIFELDAILDEITKGPMVATQVTKEEWIVIGDFADIVEKAMKEVPREDFATEIKTKWKKRKNK